MRLINKKLFGPLFIFTALISLCTVKVEGMESQEPINHFAPLYDLCHEHISETSIKKACSDSFGRICAMVVHDKNPSESIRWLENQPRIEIDTLFQILKEQVNCEWAPHIMCMRNSASDGMGMYFSYVFQTLEYEESLLYKKIAVLISFLDEVLASDATSSSTSATDTSASSATSSSASTTDMSATGMSATGMNAAGNGQRPAYLDNAQLLQDTVESKIMWEGWERIKGAGQGLWESGQGMWRYITNSCEIL